MSRTTTRSLAAVASAVLLAAATVATVAPATAASVADGQTTAGTAAAADDDVLRTGERLEQGDSLVSPDGRTRLQLSLTGGLTLVDTGVANVTGAPFVVRTYAPESGPDVLFLVLQTDGNLVGVGANRVPVVSFSTQGSGATQVRVQDDRNVVFARADGAVVRQEGTYRHDVVEAGDALLPGDSVQGERGLSTLRMQQDGNLVLYRGPVPLWSAGTQGSPGAYAIVQEDGNLVVYSAPGPGRLALWDSGTSDAFGGTTRLLVEPTQVAVERRGFLVYGSAWSSDTLLPGGELRGGESRTSPDTFVTARISDRFALLCGGSFAWLSPGPDTYYPATVRHLLRMQTDGNLVAYRFVPGGGPSAFFSSDTFVPGSRMVVQDDCNVVVYRPDGRPAWSSRTGKLG